MDNLVELGRPEDYLGAAKHACDGLGPTWYDFLREQFDRSRESVEESSLDLAREVWGLGSRIVVTTNYDKVLHWSCPDRDDLIVWDIEAPAEQVAHLRGELDRPVVWHLHGHVGNLARVILTPDGYSRLYLHEVRSDDSYHGALETLRHQFSSHSFLFLGFSFQDSHLASQLLQLEEIFRGAVGPHYVVLRKDQSEAINRVRQLKVEPILVEDYKATLLATLQNLAASSRRLTGMQAASNESSRHAASTVRVPPFHYANVVPIDFFIDRESELEEARELIRSRQSFLIVGRRRAGKTSSVGS